MFLISGHLTDQCAIRDDVITLQNPHGLPSASTPSTNATTKIIQNEKTAAIVKKASATANVGKEKESIPCMFISIR